MLGWTNSVKIRNPGKKEGWVRWYFLQRVFLGGGIVYPETWGG